MQTFLPYPQPVRSALVLDDKRLGKQRVEAIQILNTLLGYSEGWKKHPAVLMWRGYESFLVHVYLKEILDEWEHRGFKNIKTKIHYNNFLGVLAGYKVIEPDWLNSEFCLAHKSNLIRKKPEYYRRIWPHVPDDLPYIWPVKND
jgi:hypothetical protein